MIRLPADADAAALEAAARADAKVLAALDGPRAAAGRRGARPAGQLRGLTSGRDPWRPAGRGGHRLDGLPAGRAGRPSSASGWSPLRVQLGERTGIDGVDVTSADVVARAAREGRRCRRRGRRRPSSRRRISEVLDAGAVARRLGAPRRRRCPAPGSRRCWPRRSSRTASCASSTPAATAMGLGFAVLAAAECADAGGGPAEVQGAAASVVDRTRTMFYVDTLEYLRRGGRIGTAAALLATSLSVKPLLQMVEGQIGAHGEGAHHEQGDRPAGAADGRRGRHRAGGPGGASSRGRRRGPHGWPSNCIPRCHSWRRSRSPSSGRCSARISGLG